MRLFFWVGIRFRDCGEKILRAAGVRLVRQRRLCIQQRRRFVAEVWNEGGRPTREQVRQSSTLPWVTNHPLACPLRCIHLGQVVPGTARVAFLLVLFPRG